MPLHRIVVLFENHPIFHTVTQEKNEHLDYHSGEQLAADIRPLLYSNYHLPHNVDPTAFAF